MGAMLFMAPPLAMGYAMTLGAGLIWGIVALTFGALALVACAQLTAEDRHPEWLIVAVWLLSVTLMILGLSLVGLHFINGGAFR